jgi:hypothetical protein
MDPKIADALRDFAIQYPLGAALDWAKDTDSGHAFLFFLGGTAMTGYGNLRARLKNWRPAFKYGTAGAAVVCFVIAILLGVSALAANGVPPWRNGFLWGLLISVLVAVILLIFARFVKSTNVNLVLKNVDLDPRGDPSLTYKAKAVLTLTNESGRTVAVLTPEWQPAKDGVTLQVPFEKGSYRYRTGQPVLESTRAFIAPNEIFRLWIALDPSVSETEMIKKKNEKTLGTLAIPTMVEGIASTKQKYDI